MKTSLKLVGWSIAILVLHEVLLRAMANGHVAHSLLASAPSLGAALSSGSGLLAAALVVVRFVAVVIVPGMIGTAAVLALAHYFASSSSTGISDADEVAEGTGTSIGVAGTE